MPLFRCCLFILASPALTSCGPRDRAVTISGVSYYFPQTHLDGYVAPDGSGGSNKHFVRLAPPPVDYLLIYAPDKTSRPNRQGADIPTVTHVNDTRNVDVDVYPTAVGPVVCQRTPPEMDIHYTCGLRIIDAGVVWSLLFDRDLVARAPELETRAEIALLRYRRVERLALSSKKP